MVEYGRKTEEIKINTMVTEGERKPKNVRRRERKSNRNVVKPRVFDYSSSNFSRVVYYFAEDFILGKEGIK